MAEYYSIKEESRSQQAHHPTLGVRSDSISSNGGEVSEEGVVAGIGLPERANIVTKN